MRVADVLSLLAASADEAEILEDDPYLTSEDIRGLTGLPEGVPGHWGRGRRSAWHDLSVGCAMIESRCVERRAGP